jgi:hypothetical protein
LLPDFLFFRRLDEMATIGQVLALRAGVDVELRTLARRLGLPRRPPLPRRSTRSTGHGWPSG